MGTVDLGKLGSADAKAVGGGRSLCDYEHEFTSTPRGINDDDDGGGKHAVRCWAGLNGMGSMHLPRTVPKPRRVVAFS